MSLLHVGMHNRLGGSKIFWVCALLAASWDALLVGLVADSVDCLID